ncbi:hypothetical protein SY88_16780 [Clostridiales bacterium PH28_bin88]|nr:hypothetical protein SY88_16780 [Clostridiales bacterium PH28_bin88]
MSEVGKKVEQLTTDLVRTASINGTAGEVRLAEWIYNYLKVIPYFQRHPRDLFMEELAGDPLGRKNVFAMVRGTKGNSKKTVILHGHMDTVGVDDYGELKEYAFDPEGLASALAGVQLSGEVARDLASGDWMFGRGSNDMKSGLAAHLYVLEYLAERADRLSGNVLFTANPVEENQHTGIIEALEVFKRLRQEEGLDFVAAINADYTAPRFPGDDNRYVYLGAVGKLLPSFYIVGKETHVGSCFEGLDPTMIASELVRMIDLNTELCDEAEGEVTLPPTVLKMQDLKTHYTVQTPLAAYLYINYFTHTRSPLAVMQELKSLAREAFSRTLEVLNRRYEQYCVKAGLPFSQLPWEPRVLSFAELYREVRGMAGEAVDRQVEELAQEWLEHRPYDERVLCLKVVEIVHRMHPDRSPVVVVFYAPPYCPHVYVKGASQPEQKLISSLAGIVQSFSERTGQVIKLQKFFPYLSDSSYLMLDEDDETLDALIGNFPKWDTVYPLPVKTIREMNIPAINIGPWGKDAHKMTERVYKPYSFELLPQLILEAATGLLEME